MTYLRKMIQLLVLIATSIVFTACIKGVMVKSNAFASSPVLTTLQQEYLDALNEARSYTHDCGTAGVFSATSAFDWNENLYEASYEHSYDMAMSNIFSHNGSGSTFDVSGNLLGTSSTFSNRLDNNGYMGTYTAENIAAGTQLSSAKQVVAQLLMSDGHCANIMNPEFTDVAMAMVKNKNSRLIHYWTQDFGRP